MSSRRSPSPCAVRPLCATLGALLVTACIGSPAPRDHFYMLEPGAPSTPLAQPALRGTLEVERLRADALTRERAILRVAGPESVQVTPYTYHLWIDTPTVMLQRELAEYLRRAHLADRVVLPEMDVEENWVLNGWIDRLVRVTADAPERVIVTLEFALARARGGELLLRKRYQVEVASEGDGIDAAVRAFNAAVGEVFGRLVSDIAAAAAR